MNHLATKLAIALLSLFFAVSPELAQADTTYTYTGQPFSIVTAPYTTHDFVRVVMATQTPLAPNLPFGPIQVDSLVLSDGVQTIPIDPSLNTLLDIATDSHGDIDTWQIFLGSSTSQYISTQKTANVTADAGALDSVRQADNDGTPGTWRVSAATPEPASVGLFLAGMLGLFAIALRRRIVL